MVNLKQKIVLVTGGSRGIGAATALLLAQAGAHVAVTYNSAKKQAEEIRERIFGMGKRCLLVKTDVSSERSIRNAVRDVQKEFGGIDILVNNAGIWKSSPLTAMSLRRWDETMNINLRSAFLFCREVVPLMKKKGGRIINIASTAGQRGEPEYSHYAASKGGMIAFTQSIAVELAPLNINVNCVAPGWVDTDMTASVLRSRRSRKTIEATIPRGRVARAEEVAGAVLFLASNLSDHIIGASVNVNGGGVLFP